MGKNTFNFEDATCGVIEPERLTFLNTKEI